MPSKKATIKRKRMTKGRPKQRGLSGKFIELGLRATPEEAAFIQRGAELEAKRLMIPVSRNYFCLRVVIDAAKAEMERHGIKVEDVPFSFKR